MSNKRYPEEFRIEAVKQVTERGHSVADVAAGKLRGVRWLLLRTSGLFGNAASLVCKPSAAPVA